MHVIQKVLIVIGGIAVLVGALWIGQGAGLIPGSFMTGDRTWLGIGLVVACVGLVLVYIALQRPRMTMRRRPTDTDQAGPAAGEEK